MAHSSQNRVRFRLQTVLSLRASRRDECRRRLATALESLGQCTARCRQLDEQLGQHQAQMRTAGSDQQVSVERLRAASHYESALRDQMRTAAAAEHSATAEVEACRASLSAAERKVRILEKLRERLQLRAARALHVAEAKVWDEIAARTGGAPAVGTA